jgi:type I restriction enzyme R subunit
MAKTTVKVDINFEQELWKAIIRLAVKKELRGKVSINELNGILQEIMEQA